MLGRYDATNIGNPRVSVITNVDYDHTDGAEGWRKNNEKRDYTKNGILCLGEVDDELDAIFTDEQPETIYRRGKISQSYLTN